MYLLENKELHYLDAQEYILKKIQSSRYSRESGYQPRSGWTISPAKYNAFAKEAVKRFLIYVSTTYPEEDKQRYNKALSRGEWLPIYFETMKEAGVDLTEFFDEKTIKPKDLEEAIKYLLCSTSDYSRIHKIAEGFPDGYVHELKVRVSNLSGLSNRYEDRVVYALNLSFRFGSNAENPTKDPMFYQEFPEGSPLELYAFAVVFLWMISDYERYLKKNRLYALFSAFFLGEKRGNALEKGDPELAEKLKPFFYGWDEPEKIFKRMTNKIIDQLKPTQSSTHESPPMPSVAFGPSFSPAFLLLQRLLAASFKYFTSFPSLSLVPESFFDPTPERRAELREIDPRAFFYSPSTSLMDYYSKCTKFVYLALVELSGDEFYFDVECSGGGFITIAAKLKASKASILARRLERGEINISYVAHKIQRAIARATGQEKDIKNKNIIIPASLQIKIGLREFGYDTHKNKAFYGYDHFERIYVSMSSLRISTENLIEEDTIKKIQKLAKTTTRLSAMRFTSTDEDRFYLDPLDLKNSPR